MVSETKRFSIDAGSWLSRAQSTFSSDDKSPLTIGVGLAERACPTNRENSSPARPKRRLDELTGSRRTNPKGTIGVAIVLPKGSVETFTNDDPNLPDSKLHAAVPQPTHEGYPPIRDLLAISPGRSRQAVRVLFRRVLGSERRFSPTTSSGKITCAALPNAATSRCR